MKVSKKEKEQKENWDYITSLKDDALISHVRWYLNTKIETAFGGLENKESARSIIFGYRKSKVLTDSQRLLLRMSLMKN